jgi:hypothetical protein
MSAKGFQSVWVLLLAEVANITPETLLLFCRGYELSSRLEDYCCLFTWGEVQKFTLSAVRAL